MSFKKWLRNKLNAWLKEDSVIQQETAGVITSSVPQTRVFRLDEIDLLKSENNELSPGAQAIGMVPGISLDIISKGSVPVLTQRVNLSHVFMNADVIWQTVTSKHQELDALYTVCKNDYSICKLSEIGIQFIHNKAMGMNIPNIPAATNEDQEQQDKDAMIRMSIITACLLYNVENTVRLTTEDSHTLIASIIYMLPSALTQPMAANPIDIYSSMLMQSLFDLSIARNHKNVKDGINAIVDSLTFPHDCNVKELRKALYEQSKELSLSSH